MDGYLITDDGCRLWTAHAGGGRPVVLCHGGPGLWDYLPDVADLLAGTARVVRWDQRGCGRSSGDGPYTLDRMVADLDVVCRDTGEGRVALVGHSWGATLALRYALDHPERVRALAYVSGTGIDPGEPWRAEFHANAERRQAPYAGRLARLLAAEPGPERDRELTSLQWSADFADRDLALGYAQRLATPWFGINRTCHAAVLDQARRYLAETDVAGRCAGLRVPVLIVDGAEDNRPRWAVDSLHRSLPDVRRVTIAGAGHLPWYERPDEFRAAVTGFLAET